MESFFFFLNVVYKWRIQQHNICMINHGSDSGAFVNYY